MVIINLPKKYLKYYDCSYIGCRINKHNSESWLKTWVCHEAHELWKTCIKEWNKYVIVMILINLLKNNQYIIIVIF